MTLDIRCPEGVIKRSYLGGGGNAAMEEENGEKSETKWSEWSHQALS